MNGKHCSSILFSLQFLIIFVVGKDQSLDKYQPVDEDKAADYLSQFGYVSPGQLNAADTRTGMAGDVVDLFREAVKKFQSFANLPVTGVLDVKTRKKMAEPRCGMQDNVEMLSTGKGPTFKWQKKDLTYAIHNFSPDLPADQIRTAIQTAFAQWAAVSPLTFREVNPLVEQANINIRFASGYHDDPWPFDQQGGVLAHATMPSDGKLHFDEAENWVYMDPEKIATLKYTDLLPVAIHEGGHALGLSHSKADSAIMAPFYQETVDSQGRYKFPALTSDDIRAIQDIYGAKSGGRTGGGQQIPQKHVQQQEGAGRGEEGARGTSAGGNEGGKKGGNDILGTVWKHGKTALKNIFADWLRRGQR